MAVLLLLLQDTYDLTLAQAKGQILAYQHVVTVGKTSMTLKVRYQIIDLDTTRQHSGDYRAHVESIAWPGGGIETKLEPIVYRSGLHG